MIARCIISRNASEVLSRRSSDIPAMCVKLPFLLYYIPPLPVHRNVRGFFNRDVESTAFLGGGVKLD